MIEFGGAGSGDERPGVWSLGRQRGKHQYEDGKSDTKQNNN